MHPRYVSLLIVLVSFQSGYCFQVPANPANQGSKRRDADLESFELVWKTIRDTHWDESLVGDSWVNHRNDLLPEIKSAASKREARKVISKLLNRLGQSHFGIIPEDSYEVIEGFAGGQADAGLTGRFVEGQLVVTDVRAGSSADTMGVKPGWVITKIRNRTAVYLVDRFKKAAHGPQRLETIAGTTLDHKILTGSKNRSLPISFLDGTNQVREMKLAFGPKPGKLSKFGNLPPIRVTDESRTYPGNIGYYKFNAFLDPMRIMPAWQNAIRNENHSNGIIIDLRGNIGGLAGMTMGMTGEFVTEPRTLGTMTMKGTKLNFVANPRPVPVTAPVAVLVDECSISSAEILAGGLKDLDLARVFGNRTAGLAYPSVVVKLPNGDGFQYAIADYRSASGQRLEESGVIPDVEIALTRENLLRQGDPVLTAALNWLKEQR